MICVKCGHELAEEAVFCPYCGEKVGQAPPAPEGPVYQVDVKGLLKSGKLIVYRDRTEFVSSSVQKTIFNYTGLVSVKKGWDSIDFITEDGHTESCPAGRKTIHEAFLYIEQAAKPYLEERKNRLLSEGVRYSFPSSQGFLNDGVLHLSAQKAEFRAKSGKSETVPFEDVKAVAAPAGTLDFSLLDGRIKSFALDKALRDEVLAFVQEAVKPYAAARKEALLARGIYYSCLSGQGAGGGTLDVLADRVEYKGPTGQEEAVPFQAVRTASLYGGMLELALTDGTMRSFSVEEDVANEILAFVQKAVEPYMAARTVGFDTSFGIDERMEVNEERGVFHILRQGGREITDEWPLETLARCEWVERTELTALGSVVSGGIALFKTAAKAAGNQAAAETEERLSCAGVSLTFRAEQDAPPQDVWFGVFPAGMGRSNKKYERYLAEGAGLMDFLKERCPGCELVEPVPPEPKVQTPEPAAEAGDSGAEPVQAAVPDRPGEAAKPEIAALERDDLGIAKYIEGVSRFVDSCATPMTIAIQGNRGVGEDSILRILYRRLEERYGNNLLWINARQFPQGGDSGTLPLLVGKKLVALLSGEVGAEAKDRAVKIATGLAKLVTGAIISDSSIGQEMADGLFNKGAADTPEQLAALFAKQVGSRTRNGGKVVLVVDGLDRMPPARAVELLEAARDFFDCQGCVFVIAADYSAILSGAQERYGQSFDENRGKRFFDELFKMSFRVPASSYNVRSYVKSKLEHMEVPAGDEGEVDLYEALIQNSVGRDPGGINRLFDSFLLLKNMADEEMYESRYKRLALFALLCMQAEFPSAYGYAVEMRDNVTPQFLEGLCGGGAPGGEKAAFQGFAAILGQIINLDGEAGISEAECRAFAEVLEFSRVTSK